MFLFVAAIIILFYYYAVMPMGYWKNLGIAQTQPLWLFGDFWQQLFRIKSYSQIIKGIYDADPKARYYGYYQFTVPTLMIRDPSLMKQIGVKDFDHFVNHRSLIPDDVDPLWDKNLLVLKDQKWKDTRPILSPSFTSSKMKMMFNLISDCSENMRNFFLKSEESVIEVGFKDLSTRFANDVIATAAFGVQVDSLSQPDNEFYLRGKEIVDFDTFRKSSKIFINFMAPSVFKYFKYQVFEGESRKFFTNLIETNLKVREEKGIVRPDMLHLLLEAKRGNMNKEESGVSDTGYAVVDEYELGKKKTQPRSISNMDITAQALIFFVAGFDSVSSLMSFMAYELAINTDIQKKLREEIEESFEACNGKLTYEKLVKMKYLDMVISESLRKWPNFTVTDRVCTEDYVILPELPGEKPILLRKGDVVSLPIMPIHYDPKYFPDPERFDPERFNDENKYKIDTYMYHPFGIGPRNCIGSRFALLETKIFFAYLLNSFEIVPTSKTNIPVVLSTKSINLNAADGMQLGLRKMEKTA